ncbi:MAG: hypothetical protein FJY36_03050 [Betaproteobacteria bacterium]|nr:hypothetical protein [Betaproteobacteria bacterium]
MSDTPHTAAPLSALLVQAQPGLRLSPAQEHFNRLVQQVAALSEQIAWLASWEAQHRHAHVQALHRSQQQAQALAESLILQLHARLQSDALTASQQRIARRKLRQLLTDWPSAAPEIQALLVLGREEGEDQAAAEDAREAAQRLRQQIEEVLGQPLDGGDRHLSPEDVMAAGMRQWQRQQDAAEARKRAKRAARLEKKKPQAHARQQAQQLDAKSALRTVYRQLASALHPDREPVAAERERKTALMSAVNAAYERGDLSTLLHLQMQNLPNAAPGTVADERLVAMAWLLKEQVKALQDDVQQWHSRLLHELGVVVGADADAAAMDGQLQRQRHQAEQEVAALQADGRSVGSDALFKSWLKAQGVAMKEAALAAASLWD